MEQYEFVVVTDGSVGEFDMSFGWIIYTVNGENIAEHAVEYMALTTQLKGQLYLDNKGVITRIQQQKSYSHDYSFNTLTP
eukprot:8527370-Ditylum_brightwellii.AAC.1